MSWGKLIIQLYRFEDTHRFGWNIKIENNDNIQNEEGEI
jgi:hypothetical protein